MFVFWSYLILYHKVVSSFYLIRIKFYASSAKIDRKVEIEDRCSLTKNKSNFNIKIEENMHKGELYL